ncbi:nucleic acid-binding protein [Bacillus paranthracis]|nr:nucleic acid-binding protein [Bacillus paranthracis]
MMGRNDNCFCGSGKKRKKCHSYISEDSYIESLYKLYHEIEIIKKDHQYPLEHPCKKGCHECCYDFFSITMLEFEAILASLKRHGMNYTREIFNIALEFNSFIEKNDPELYAYFEKDLTGSDFAEEYYFQRRLYNNRPARLPFPCPLLNKEDKSCSVYEDRPFICRTHGNTFNTSTNLYKNNSPTCEYIVDSVENTNYTPEVTDEFYTKMMDLNKLVQGEMKSYLLQYPIFYWFKLYKDKNERHNRDMCESLVPAYFYKKVDSLQRIDVR